MPPPQTKCLSILFHAVRLENTVKEFVMLLTFFSNTFTTKGSKTRWRMKVSACPLFIRFQFLMDNNCRIIERRIVHDRNRPFGPQYPCRCQHDAKLNESILLMHDLYPSILCHYPRHYRICLHQHLSGTHNSICKRPAPHIPYKCCPLILKLCAPSFVICGMWSLSQAKLHKTIERRMFSRSVFVSTILK